MCRKPVLCVQVSSLLHMHTTALAHPAAQMALQASQQDCDGKRNGYPRHQRTTHTRRDATGVPICSRGYTTSPRDAHTACRSQSLVTDEEPLGSPLNPGAANEANQPLTPTHHPPTHRTHPHPHRGKRKAVKWTQWKYRIDRGN